MHTEHCTLRTTNYTYCTLHAKHWYTAYCILHKSYCTFNISNITLIPAHCTLKPCPLQTSHLLASAPVAALAAGSSCCSPAAGTPAVLSTQYCRTVLFNAVQNGVRRYKAGYRSDFCIFSNTFHGCKQFKKKKYLLVSLFHLFGHLDFFKFS